MSPSLKRSGMVAAIAAVAGLAAIYFCKPEAQVEESGKPMITVMAAFRIDTVQVSNGWHVIQ